MTSVVDLSSRVQGMSLENRWIPLLDTQLDVLRSILTGIVNLLYSQMQSMRITSRAREVASVLADEAANPQSQKILIATLIGICEMLKPLDLTIQVGAGGAGVDIVKVGNMVFGAFILILKTAGTLVDAKVDLEKLRVG